ncbi:MULTISPECIES: hypothetical protein [unclassified Saccharothrix]|uniref:hypothetical protein n=1 Tax=unclassified Saccharothrix TaxID=2593673 RepID=UPI0017B4CA2D|nr:hypothetical protein [Saccharothrix sp.]
MLYVLALIGALTIAVLLWRAFGPDRVDSAPSRRVIAPDDDPEFLRKLGEQTKKRPDEE